jgi:hypothetical protein
MKQSLATTPRFANENIGTEGDSIGSMSSYGPVLHSKIWMTYSMSKTKLIQNALTISSSNTYTSY